MYFCYLFNRDEDNAVYFNDVLYAAFKRAFGSNLYEKGAEGSKAALLLHIQDKEMKRQLKTLNLRVNYNHLANFFKNVRRINRLKPRSS